jgi:hypothetical protein
MVHPTAFRVEGCVQQQRAAVRALDLALAAHAEFFQRALTREVVRAGDRHHAIEAHDIEGEGQGGAAEFRPVTLALRLGREGAAQRHAVVALMDAQATQADQPSARALACRPAAETQGLPLGLVVRHQRIAFSTRQHAMPEKIHHSRIGMQNGQPFGIGHSDRMEIKPLGQEMVTVQDESLPVPVAGL